MSDEPRRSELHSSVNTSIAAKTALQVSSLAKDGSFTVVEFPWNSRCVMVNNQRITCTWMSSHKQTVGCNLVSFRLLLFAKT